MHDRRFDALRKRLVREGISPRYARRLTGELAQHWSDLTEAAVASGMPPAEAELLAHRQLGCDDHLARYAQAGGRFRAFGRSHPVICFLVLPPLAVGCVAAASVTLLYWSLVACRTIFGLQPELWWNPLTKSMVAWVVPALCAFLTAAWCIYARRRFCPICWPLLACAVLSVLAAFVFIDVLPPAEPSRGAIVAGVRVDRLASTSLGIMLLPAATFALLWLEGRSSPASASEPDSL